jgi:ATP-dependent Lon protease
LKEKVLAAHRAGIKRVIVPERNKPDLDEVPAEVKSDLEFVFVSKMDQVLDAALEEKLVPKPAESSTETPATPAAPSN